MVIHGSKIKCRTCNRAQVLGEENFAATQIEEKINSVAWRLSIKLETIYCTANNRI